MHLKQDSIFELHDVLERAQELEEKVSRCESCSGKGKIEYHYPNGNVEHTRVCKACDGEGVRPGSVEEITKELNSIVSY